MDACLNFLFFSLMSNPNTPVNKFPVGNQLYKLASNTGRPKLFTTPQDLLSAACNYFEYVENNPVIKYGVYGKDAKIIGVPKMRAMSLQGLYAFIGVCNLRRYKQHAEFVQVIAYIENVINVHNINGASAGLLNPCIVARLLGLKERVAKENMRVEVVVYVPDSGCPKK